MAVKPWNKGKLGHLTFLQERSQAESGDILAAQCSFDVGGRDSCSGLLDCQGYGQLPTTLAEYALNMVNIINEDFYDISLVDGFNLPLSITPSNPNCKRHACSSNITAQCPTELKVTDGCKSACAAFNTPQYCWWVQNPFPLCFAICFPWKFFHCSKSLNI